LRKEEKEKEEDRRERKVSREAGGEAEAKQNKSSPLSLSSLSFFLPFLLLSLSVCA